MNAWEMLIGVGDRTNRPKSPRFAYDRIARALTRGQRDFMKDRIDNIKKSIREKTYSIEQVKRVKDELQTIVLKGAPAIDPVTGVIILPPKYYYELGIKIQVNGLWVSSKPWSVGERDATSNVYNRATIVEPRHIEYQNQIEVEWGGGIATIGGTSEFWYVYMPDNIYIALTNVSAGPTAVLPTTRYVVDSGSVTYDGNTYTENQDFQTGAITVLGGTGTARQIVNSALPDAAHDEIVNRASDILAADVENFQRSQNKKNEIATL